MKKVVVVMALLAMCGTTVQADMVAKWSFEQNLLDTASSGTAADNLVGMKNYPGNGSYGTSALWQDPTYESGISGSAVRIGAIGTYSYEGTNTYPWASGYVAPASGATYLSTTSDSVDLSLAGGVFTMEGFFKADTVMYAYTRLLTKWVSGFNQSVHFTIHNGALEVIQKNSSGANMTVLDDQTLAALGVEANEWFHTAVTGNGSTLTLWLNGQAVASGAYNGTMNDSTDPFWIGGRHDILNPATNNNAFVGVVDEVIVWNEAKDATYMASRAAMIPEPATLLLLGLGGLSAIKRSRR